MYRPEALAALGIDYGYGGYESLDAVDAMALRRGQPRQEVEREDEDQG